MGSSLPPSRLTPLQRDLLTAFFDREKRFVLTGGAALAGLPGGVDPVRLVAFRDELVRKLRTMAFARATRDE